jgi:hypothetical protein
MTIRADIAPIDTAVVGALRMGAEVTGGVDLSRPASGERHLGRRCAGHLRRRHLCLLAQLAVRLVGIPGKRLGFPFASGRLGYLRSGLIDAPEPENQQQQQDEESIDKRVRNQIDSHDQPLQSGGTWADHTAFGDDLN